MKKKLIKLTAGIIIALSLTINVLAAVKWGGSKDVTESKNKIVMIQELIRDKNKRLTDKDKVIADKEKAILDKEKTIGEKETVIVQLEQRVAEKEKVIADLQRELDNQSSVDKQALKQAESDVKELNRLLGEVLEEPK